MIESKTYAKTKTKKFATDKDRRQYFAIQSYYKKKEPSQTLQKTNKKSKY